MERNLFDIVLVPTRMSTSLPRAALKAQAYAKQSFLYPGTLGDQLKDLSIQEGVNLLITLFAAFETLLYRYAGQDDFRVARVAVRTGAKSEGLRDLLPTIEGLRSDLTGNPTFREVLIRMRSAALAASETQATPFQDGKHGHAQGSMGSSRLQVASASQEGQPTSELPGLTVRVTDETQRSSEFGLCLSAWVEPQALGGEVEYSTSLFDADIIDRMIGHFQTLLDGIAANPDQHIALLPILTECERRRQLIQWNDTKTPSANPQCIHELFEAQVERTPDHIALVFEGHELSYRELNREANRLARRLRKLAVGPESLVGLYLPRSFDMVVGLLGILKAGAAYVPLDPTYPRERLAFMLHDSGAQIVVTEHSLLKELPSGHSAAYLCLDADDTEFEKQLDTNLGGGAATPENLAYVMYTSGSTGRPKGIQITHRAVVNLLDSVQRQLQLTSKDRLLAVTTVCFDMSVVELYLPLSAGAAVIIASGEMVADGRLLAEQLLDERITIMQATPATWRLVLEGGWNGRDLKIICGGENLPRELATELSRQGASLWNMYGPTEITVYALTHKVVRGGGTVPIGRPIGNTQVYILDPHLQPLPVGMLGEVYIGGAGLARGYLNRPELTAEKFVTHRFSEGPETRLYRTGDLARFLPDGNIEYLGRLDHQVKIRGFRIELGEIETILSEYPSVNQAIVIAREDVPGEKKLVAYIHQESNQTPSSFELQSYLCAKLPDYMVPTAFVFLDKLPRTPNGKIDRRALPAPDSVRSTSEDGFVAPRTNREMQLARIWARVLGIQPIGIRDNFFDLGGHSLLGLRVLKQIEKTFNKKLPMTALYVAPTIEQLAKSLVTEHSLLLPLQVHGNKLPFVWVHGQASDALLARYLGKDRPLYGFRHQSHDDGTPARYSTVEDIAAHYIDELLTVRPYGPYLLGGYCFGGIVALEMARQLTKWTQEVPILVLVDPDSLNDSQQPLSSPLTSNKSLTEGTSRAIRRNLQNLRRLPPRGQLEYVATRLKQKIIDLPLFRKMSKIGKSVVSNFCLSFRCPLPKFVRSQYILGVYAQALKRYAPQTYCGQVIIFKTADVAFDVEAWRGIAIRGIEMHEVPGSHTEVLREPYVRVWAEKLKAFLDNAPAKCA
jgi:amino acid adenylation domain-containing protein